MNRGQELTERIRKAQDGVWDALLEIHEGRLYKTDLGYPTMEEWAQLEFGWTHNYLGRQIRAAETRNQIAKSVPIGTLSPTIESQVRSIATLEPEVQAEIWEAAVERSEGKPPTAKMVQEVKAEKLYVPPPPVPAGEYNVLYADPPWQFDNSGFEQSAASHYPTMSTRDICALDIPKASVCFMWATASMLPDALEALTAWGFQYKTHMIWAKDRGPSIGFWLKTRHELLLIGTSDGQKPNFLPASWVEANVTQHSRKPAEFYDIIEKMYDGPYLEMFARSSRDGWEAWGNEI